MTRHERRMAMHSLKKGQRTAENKKPKLGITLSSKTIALLFVFAAAALAAYWLFYLPQTPSIKVEPERISFGSVSMRGGVKTVSLSVSNQGKSDLVITGMESSCGCTTAALVLNGTESPRFGMPGHGTENPKNWKATLTPNQTAQLKIYYDPRVHPELRGAVTRTVSISSNDPLFSIKKITITANQVS